jgi:hypothetical protein
MSRDELLQLAERVERAEGPDRALDGLIHILANPDLPWIIGQEPGPFPQTPIYGTLSDFREWAWRSCDAAEAYERRDPADGIGAPFYTASLDAAMSLVPEGWTGLELLAPVDDAVLWSAYFHGPFGCWDGFGATRELAIVSASLKALASQIGGEG